MLKNTSAKAETRTNLTSPHKGRVKPLKEIEEIVLAPTRGQRKFSRPRDNLRSLQEHPVQGCEWTRSVQSALSARRQGSSQRRRRLTTPLRLLRILVASVSLQRRVCLPLVVRRPGTVEKARIGVYASSALFAFQVSHHFRGAAVPPNGEPCATLRGVVRRLRLWLEP